MKGLKDLVSKADNLLTGLAAAPGLVIAKAHVYHRETLRVADDPIQDVNEALLNFDEALARAKKEIGKIFSLAKESIDEKRAGIFEAQMMILEDDHFLRKIKGRIIAEMRVPEYIIFDEFNKYKEMFLNARDPNIRERAEDIEDIKSRVIRNLQNKRLQSRIAQGSLIVAEILTPADTLLFAKAGVKGFVTDRGGLASHTAIIARSLNIPAVVGTHHARDLIKQDDLLIIDGFHGLIFINPDDEQLQYFYTKLEHLTQINKDLENIRSLPSATEDGRVINLFANVDVSGEIESVISNGAKGIGLYRTEQIIEEMGEFPDEEEQQHIYENLSHRIYPGEVTIRAFDIGGDKVSIFDGHEANPFLGLRGIRFLLQNQPLFKSQLRAILRASINRNIRFMLPMVSTLEEVRDTKVLLEECRTELRAEGVQYDENMKIGIMIEVPSAAFMIRDLAKEVDFFSIGTNDLIQYMMAVDRGNDLVANLYKEFHPSVLRVLNRIIKEANENKVEISICGEMAADTIAVPVLIGLGLRNLSVSAMAIPYIKRTVRASNFAKCEALAEKILKYPTDTEIVAEIEEFFTTNSINRTRNIL